MNVQFYVMLLLVNMALLKLLQQTYPLDLLNLQQPLSENVRNRHICRKRWFIFLCSLSEIHEAASLAGCHHLCRVLIKCPLVAQLVELPISSGRKVKDTLQGQNNAIKAILFLE